MSILSDKDIKRYINEGKLVIDSYDELSIQPSSVDLHLAFMLQNLNEELFDLRGGSTYVLQPQEFILGSTVEWIEIPDDLVGVVEGRSSVGRLGVAVHITAGYIDPGFHGNITLEIYNVSDKPFVLKRDMTICQIVFHTLSSECENPYGSPVLNSKYQNSKGTILSRYEELDFE